MIKQHGNTAFCNRVFLKVGSWIPIGFGKQQNERFGAWATKSFFALFPAACVFVTCVSCDERPTDKFCPRIYHWVSVRFGFSFVLGKTFSSGTNSDRFAVYQLFFHSKTQKIKDGRSRNKLIPCVLHTSMLSRVLRTSMLSSPPHPIPNAEHVRSAEHVITCATYKYVM